MTAATAATATPTTPAVVMAGRRTLEIREVTASGRPASGGWITVDACGICGSDWNAYIREQPAAFIPGHEIVGTVTELWGESLGRSDVAVGDRVVLEEALACHRCAVCLAGRHRLCPYSGRYGGTPLPTEPGLWGGFARTVYLAPNARVHHVPADLDSALATLFIPLSNGLSWLGATAGLRAGESVLVLGVGQHGLATVAAARRHGAGTIVAAGRTGDDERLRAARALGATATVDVDTAVLGEVVAELTGGRGIDITVDTTPGATTTVGDAVGFAAIGGRVVVAGLKRGARSEIDSDVVARREISLHGVAARESRYIDAALSWLAGAPELAGPFGGLTVALPEFSRALSALGGEGPGPRPSHAVVDLRLTRP